MARKVVVSPDRRLYFATELDNCSYTLENANYAEYWLKWGDWTLKGTDPTLTLDDFFPTLEQYESGYKRRHYQPNAHHHQPTMETRISNQTPMTEGEMLEMALWIIHAKEPKWGFKLDVPWIRKYDKHKIDPDVLDQIIAKMDKAANKHGRYATSLDKGFANYRRQYIDSDGFMR